MTRPTLMKTRRLAFVLPGGKHRVYATLAGHRINDQIGNPFDFALGIGWTCESSTVASSETGRTCRYRWLDLRLFVWRWQLQLWVRLYSTQRTAQPTAAQTAHAHAKPDRV